MIPYRTSTSKIQINQFKPIDNMLKTLSDERLQHVVNTLNESKTKADAATKLDLSEETLNRYIRDANGRGIEYTPHNPNIKLPKVFIFDLENAPSKAALYGMWKQNINPVQITEEWYMLSWSGKWLFDTEMYSDVLTPAEAIEGSDKRIMESLWSFIDDADILIGHNINQFDVLKMNTRFVLNSILPPSPYQTIDTLLAARKNFAFSHNKLDYLCEQFGVAQKADNGGMARWLGCCEGNPEDLIEMEKYNRQDIVATEELYMALRPWIKTHPNLALYMEADSDACYKCGSTNIKWLYNDSGEAKYYYTNVNKYPVYRCNECNSPGRSRHTAMSRDEKKVITSPVAR